MTSGFHLKHRLGLGLLTTLAAVTALFSCNQDRRLTAGPDAASIDYITIEFIQTSAKWQDVYPDFYVDVPAGTQLGKVKLADGDVADHEDFVAAFHVDPTGYTKNLELGLNWQPRKMLMSIYVTDHIVDRDKHFKGVEHIYEGYMMSLPESMFELQEVIEERDIVFADYSGTIYYHTLELAKRQEWLQFSDFPDVDGNPADGPPVLSEEVLLFARNDTHYIIVKTQAHGIENSMPEMMDIAIQVAKSIRIKEASANDD